MLNRDNTGLIVIDIQGKLARLAYNSEELITHCEKLIQGAKVLGLPIIWLEQNPEKMGNTVEELSALLTPQNPIAKFSFNACDEPLFMKKVGLANVDNWLICGIEAHICVYQTAMNLQRSGYKVQLVTDCVSSRTLTNKNLAISKLSNHGIDISGLEMCLYELVKDCKAPEFKDILALAK